MWKCKCGEVLENSFELCFACKTSRVDGEDQSFRNEQASRKATLARNLKACAKCGSQKILPSVKIVDENGELGSTSLKARVERKPYAFFLKGSENSLLYARICGECGYAELYARNPKALWKAHQERDVDV